MKKIVFITSRFPYPLDKGDKLRAYNQIRDLAEFAQIHLISMSEREPSPDELAALQPFCASINNFVLPKRIRLLGLFRNLFSEMPFSVGYFFNRKIRVDIHQRIREISPDVIHCHLIRTSPYVHGIPCAVRSIDFMDCFSLGARKELLQTQNSLRKIFLRIEYQRLLKFEKNAFEAFDKHWIIAKPDRIALPVDNAESVQILPNGVDFNIFFPKETNKEFDVLFSGHMGYIPNISAARYAITQIAPQLSKPQKLLIAGIGVTDEIRKLSSSRVIIREKFQHIREAFWMSKILVAPMQISIGLQNKILQAMAMRIPVICSSQANGSIGALPGHSIIEANTPMEYVEAIDQLLDDPEHYREIVENAFHFVSNNFSWKGINAQFSKMILK